MKRILLLLLLFLWWCSEQPVVNKNDELLEFHKECRAVWWHLNIRPDQYVDTWVYMWWRVECWKDAEWEIEALLDWSEDL